MASIIRTKIIVDVKNGDVFDEMRLNKCNGEKGRSNTGTYFLCSKKDFDRYEPFFKNCKNYYFDMNKIAEYKILLKEHLSSVKNQYLDKMESFDLICDELLSSDSNSISGLNFRINDTRYFLRFNDNNERLVKAFRHILYGEVTSLVIEFDGDNGYVYPQIKYEDKIYFD